MGLIISRFRKQKTTIEILEEIDKNIATNQRFKRQNQEYQKKFIASLILYSIIIYVAVTILFFICYFPQSWKDWLFASIPLLLFPILIWLVKKLMHWYFVKRISSNEFALQELRDKKKDILEDVMENETYKKAKEILEKYDPARFKKLEVEKPVESKPNTVTEEVPEDRTTKPDNKVVRQRIITTRTMSPVVRMPNPVQPMSAPHPHQRIPNPSVGSPMQMATQFNGRQMSMVPHGYGRSPGPPMPRPVPPRERKTLDKFIDYLVGEGPQNRYALICRYCHSHNGMAMKEEFEYVSFRCCYCYHLNPAKKQRPHAPRLDFPTPQSSPARKPVTAPDSQSNQEKESSEDDDASTSSQKSDEETEKVDEKTDEKTVVEASKPIVELAEDDDDDIAMADEDVTEENADKPIERHVEDEGILKNLKEQSSPSEDIMKESPMANNPQEEESTEKIEQKFLTKEASESLCVETLPLSTAEKPSLAKDNVIICTEYREPEKIDDNVLAPISEIKQKPGSIKDFTIPFEKRKAGKMAKPDKLASTKFNDEHHISVKMNLTEDEFVVKEAPVTSNIGFEIFQETETVEKAQKVVEEAKVTLNNKTQISPESETLKLAPPMTEKSLVTLANEAKASSETETLIEAQHMGKQDLITINNGAQIPPESGILGEAIKVAEDISATFDNEAQIPPESGILGEAIKVAKDISATFDNEAQIPPESGILGEAIKVAEDISATFDNGAQIPPELEILEEAIKVAEDISATLDNEAQIPQESEILEEAIKVAEDISATFDNGAQIPPELEILEEAIKVAEDISATFDNEAQIPPKSEILEEAIKVAEDISATLDNEAQIPPESGILGEAIKVAKDISATFDTEVQIPPESEILEEAIKVAEDISATFDNEAQIRPKSGILEEALEVAEDISATFDNEVQIRSESEMLEEAIKVAEDISATLDNEAQIPQESEILEEAIKVAEDISATFDNGAQIPPESGFLGEAIKVAEDMSATFDNEAQIRPESEILEEAIKVAEDISITFDNETLISSEMETLIEAQNMGKEDLVKFDSEPKEAQIDLKNNILNEVQDINEVDLISLNDKSQISLEYEALTEAGYVADSVTLYKDSQTSPKLEGGFVAANLESKELEIAELKKPDQMAREDLITEKAFVSTDMTVNALLMPNSNAAEKLTDITENNSFAIAANLSMSVKKVDEEKLIGIEKAFTQSSSQREITSELSDPETMIVPIDMKIPVKENLVIETQMLPEQSLVTSKSHFNETTTINKATDMGLQESEAKAQELAETLAKDLTTEDTTTSLPQIITLKTKVPTTEHNVSQQIVADFGNKDPVTVGPLTNLNVETMEALNNIDNIKNKNEATEETINKPIPTTEETINKPIPTTEETINKPIPTTEETINKPIPTTEETINKPIPTTEETINKPIPTTEETINKPIPTTEETINKPIPTTEETINKPIPTTEETINKPIPTTEETINKPIPTTEETINKPIPTTEETINKPIPTTEETINKPIPTTEETINKPIPTTEETINKPIPTLHPTTEETISKEASEAMGSNNIEISDTIQESVDFEELEMSMAIIDAAVKDILLMSARVDAQHNPEGTSKSVSNENLFPDKNSQEETTDPKINESKMLRKNNTQLILNESLFTTSNVNKEGVMSMKNNVHQIGQETLLSTGNVTGEGMVPIKNDAQQIAQEALLFMGNVAEGVLSNDTQEISKEFLTTRSSTFEKSKGQSCPQEAMVSVSNDAAPISLELLESVENLAIANTPLSQVGEFHGQPPEHLIEIPEHQQSAVSREEKQQVITDRESDEDIERFDEYEIVSGYGNDEAEVAVVITEENNEIVSNSVSENLKRD